MLLVRTKRIALWLDGRLCHVKFKAAGKERAERTKFGTVVLGSFMLCMRVKDVHHMIYQYLSTTAYVPATQIRTRYLSPSFVSVT